MTAERARNQPTASPPDGRGPLTPEKHFSTGEVMDHTGLSRQTLHNYKRLGLITPVRWTTAGHCYYDASVFERLRKIKLYQRHRSLQEIRALLDSDEPEPTAPGTDSHAEPADDASALATLRRSGEGRPDAPPRQYRIGDVMRITGYSRQTLHNYTIQGLIQPRERTPAGHRLYGEEVFETLRLIEVFKRHRRFHEVQRLIDEWRDAGRTGPGSGLLENNE